MVHLLLPYVPLTDHQDPILEEFTYGDVDVRARKLKRDLKQGDYVFFHTTIRGIRYITAYYVVERVHKTSEAASDRAIVAKYRNPHIREYLDGERRDQDDVMIFGDSVLSRKLPHPLPFDRKLAEKLSLKIPFKKGFTENQCISSATRQWRELTESDVRVLLSEIKRHEKKGITTDAVLSTDEVLEIREADLENFIVRNSSLIGLDLKLIRRQVDTPEGRVDLLFEDKNKTLFIVELKLNEIGRGAVNQLRRYLHHFQKSTKRDVRGVIVCKDILPAFVDEFKKLRDIKILNFGWKLTVHPRKYD